MGDVEATAVLFATAARALGQAARRHGLVSPGFRSPPRLVDADRTLKRRADGWAVVAVRFRGRPWPAVLADMIDGVVAANGLRGADADHARAALWAAAESASLVPGGGPATGPERMHHPPPSASRGQARRVARRPSLHAVSGTGTSRAAGRRDAA